jgi:hypothetical protein
VALDAAAFKKRECSITAGGLCRARQQQSQNANPKPHPAHRDITRDLHQLLPHKIGQARVEIKARPVVDDLTAQQRHTTSPVHRTHRLAKRWGSEC